jgi:hypothetical protein
LAVEVINVGLEGQRINLHLRKKKSVLLNFFCIHLKNWGTVVREDEMLLQSRLQAVWSGATTFSITTLTIIKFSITTLSIMTFSIMILYKGLFATRSISNIQLK